MTILTLLSQLKYGWAKKVNHIFHTYDVSNTKYVGKQ